VSIQLLGAIHYGVHNFGKLKDAVGGIVDMSSADTMTNEEVSDFLSIPLLAVGQVVLDGKLRLISINSFDRSEVESLKESDPVYLKSLN